MTRNRRGEKPVPARHRRAGRGLAVAGVAIAGWATVGMGTAAAATQGCPDIEVMFARGTFEAPGVGAIGAAFIDALRARVPEKDVAVYPVNYPASLDFHRAADGVIDISQRLTQMGATCPGTTVVLGGYSQGAAVAAYTTVDNVPQGYVLPAGVTGPLPASAADRVAAVALFGKPSAGVLHLLDGSAPPMEVGGAYRERTIDLCAPHDPVCFPHGFDRAAHSSYRSNGMADQAADFVAGELAQRA